MHVTHGWPGARLHPPQLPPMHPSVPIALDCGAEVVSPAFAFLSNDGVRHADVRTLIGPDLLSSATEERMLLELNKSQFGAVTLPSGGQVLITPHGELPDGFIDPTSKPPQLLAVNHSKLTCTAKPLSGPHLSELQAVAKYRDPIDAAMRAHASEWLPSAVVTTYGSSSPGVKITCCVAALASDLANYSAGRWWGEWTLTTGGGGVGLLVGQIKCNIHYFEDGNVQLEDTGKYQCELPMGVRPLSPHTSAPSARGCARRTRERCAVAWMWMGVCIGAGGGLAMGGGVVWGGRSGCDPAVVRLW